MKYLFSIILFCAISFISNAQYFYYDDQYYDNDILFEGGLSFGLMNSATDVGLRNGGIISPGRYDWGSTKMCMGLYAGVTYKSLAGARLEFTRGTVGGSDARSSLAFIKNRNLSYKSHIIEAALTVSLYPMTLLNNVEIPTISPYIMAGIGYFSFYPKALYNGDWVGLRRLHTEGQNTSAHPGRKEYNLKSLSLPLGLGLKYEYSAKFNFRMEGVFRFTGTDYIDDVSKTYADQNLIRRSVQKEFKDAASFLSHAYKELNPNQDRTNKNRGNPTNNDKFFTITIKAGYVLGRTKIPINDVP